VNNLKGVSKNVSQFQESLNRIENDH